MFIFSTLPPQPLGSVSLAMPLSRKKEDEVSVGSTPLAKQASNQPSEYASSPVKTKTVTGMLSYLAEKKIHIGSF